jgi:hypothetical protein
MGNQSTTTLGAFSISLAVKDIQASKLFYAKLGFEATAGNESENWLILRNGYATIGIFQGMFEDNILTLNPGWDGQVNGLEDFADIREIQKKFKSKNVELTSEADDSTTGPASLTECPHTHHLDYRLHRPVYCGLRWSGQLADKSWSSTNKFRWEFAACQ